MIIYSYWIRSYSLVPTGSSIFRKDLNIVALSVVTVQRKLMYTLKYQAISRLGKVARDVLIFRSCRRKKNIDASRANLYRVH